MNDKTLVERLRDEDSYYRIQEKHWCVDAEELERQRLAAADRIEALEAEVAQAAKAERDRIVAWLRDKADDYKPFGTTQGDPTGCVLSLAACAIEESQP